MNNAIEQDVLTIEEVADRLRLSLAGAYRLVHRGAFPARRCGRLIRVPAGPFREWLEGTERLNDAQPTEVNVG